MKNLTVTSKHRGNVPIHLDNGKGPSCGAKPKGSLVVDVENIHYVTCEHCTLLTAVGLLGGVTLIDRRN